jgi:hypothetical protein
MSKEPEVREAEIVEGVTDDLPDIDQPLVPQMNVAAPAIPEQVEERPCPVSPEKLVGTFEEILEDIRGDKKEIDELIANLRDMVFNDGDSTTASKEALVKLIELKIGAADRKAKVADLMTRVFLKERDTFKPYMQKNEQNNTVVVQAGEPSTKRELLRTIHQARKKIGGK